MAFYKFVDWVDDTLFGGLADDLNHAIFGEPSSDGIAAEGDSEE